MGAKLRQCIYQQKIWEYVNIAAYIVAYVDPQLKWRFYVYRFENLIWGQSIEKVCNVMQHNKNPRSNSTSVYEHHQDHGSNRADKEE